jgi:hypothetical protein
MRSAPVLDDHDTLEFEVPAETTHAPAGFAHRVGAFLLRELREMLPPTIFFFIGFNLIVLTTNLLLADYGAQFGSFMLAAAAALIVGKAVLVANAMRSLRHYDRAPLIRPILYKSVFIGPSCLSRASSNTGSGSGLSNTIHSSPSWRTWPRHSTGIASSRSSSGYSFCS